MISLKKINTYINNLANEKLAEDWDNVGILIGDENQNIKKILITLDVTTRIVSEAIDNNVDLIIAHHPLIFKPIKNLNFSDFKSRIIRDLIKNDIALIATHTNLDSATLGLNDYLAKKLELENTSILFENKFNNLAGLGRVGNLKKSLSQDDFIDFVKDKLNLEFVKFVKSNDRYIHKIAVLGGSGGSFVYNIPDVDIYLTGDIGYHHAVDAKELNKNLLDIGHFAEIASKELLKNYLTSIKELSKIDILLSNVENNPFKIK